MSIRSRSWVRTWTIVLAFTVTLLISLAASRAEQPQAAPGPNVQNAFSALVEKPTAANLQAVRGLLAADAAYDPYSADLTQLSKLLHEGKNQEFVALMAKSQPNLLLSPRAHQLAAEAAKGLGDKSFAATETVRADRCVEAILATGEGSEARPFLVARVSDEADILEAKFKTQIDSQTLVFRDDKKYDRILGKDGNTYWFDVGMPVQRVTAMQVQSPAAATPGGESAPSQAHGLQARAAVPPTEVTALVQRGLDAYRAGEDDAALSALSEAIALDPRDAGIRVDRGNVWYVKREYVQAIADFSEAIRLDPSRATAYSNRGLAFSAVGEQDQAVTDFNAAIRLQANFARAYNGRGCVFQAKDMTETAIADFDEAIRLDPSYAAAYENRSTAYAKLGNQGPADADAAKARQLRGVKATPPASTTAVAEAPEK